MKRWSLLWLAAMFALLAPPLRSDEWVGLGPRAVGLENPNMERSGVTLPGTVEAQAATP